MSYMKHCPQCGRQYPADLSFCLEDGEPLSADPVASGATQAKTEEFPGSAAGSIETKYRPTIGSDRPLNIHSPKSPQRGGKFIYLFVGVIFAAGIVVVAAAFIGGYLYYSSLREQSKSLNPLSPDPPPPANVGAANVESANGKTNNGSVSNNADPNVWTTSPSSTPLSNPSATKPSATPTPTPKPRSTQEPTDQDPGEIYSPVPKQISGGVLNGKAIVLPKPPYPPAARAVRAAGSVTVQVLVDENGNVVSATAVSGHPLLRTAATNAAKSAKFSPTKLAGVPVKVSGVITYNFVP